MFFSGYIFFKTNFFYCLQIGLLREGSLLAEKPPSELLNKFQTDSLEKVFLILSQKQNEGKLDAVDFAQNIKAETSSTTTLNSMYTTHGSVDVSYNINKSIQKFYATCFIQR